MSSSFRENDIKFLKEQHLKATEALSKVEQERDDAHSLSLEYEEQFRTMQAELDRVLAEVMENEQSSKSARLEVNQLDESIRITAERNRLLRETLIEAETSLALESDRHNTLSLEHQRLTRLMNELSSLQKSTDEQVSIAESEAGKIRDDWLRVTAEKDQLLNGVTNLRSHAKAELDSIEETLRQEKKRNTELLHQQRSFEVTERKLQSDTDAVKIRKQEESREMLKLQGMIESASTDSELILKQKQDLANKLISQKTIKNKLKEHIADSELQITRERSQFETSATTLREAASNVYALSDQLRLLQLQRKKRIEENTSIRKNIDAQESTINVLNAKLQTESDQHSSVVQDLRKAEQLTSLLKKKHKQLEDAYQLAVKNQEKADRDLEDAKAKSTALNTQNVFLSNRIEALEEEVGTTRHDTKQLDSQIQESQISRKQKEAEIATQQDLISTIQMEIAKLTADLEYIKREDLLDETGRVKPLLIESDSDPSGLVSKLRINEFLVKAQQEPKQAIPLMIEKIAHLLELIQTAQTQSEQYMADLQKSNAYVTTLRDKNKVITEDVTNIETHKTQALVRILSNSLFNGKPQLLLGSLGYGKEELTELLMILQAHPDITSQLEKISLRDNRLTDELLFGIVKEIVDTAGYLRELDLRNNFCSQNGLTQFASQLRFIEGVTGVTRDDSRIVVMSGPQVRLNVTISGNSEPKENIQEDVTVSKSSIAALNL